MNKGELITSVADAAGISKADATTAVNTVFNAIEDTLKAGDKASFIGFGTFSTSHRAAREGRNPLTGEKMQIKAKTMVKFKAGKALADAVN
ncbi:MAG: HU family DNA-binding protein [Bacteroidota bacterium]